MRVRSSSEAARCRSGQLLRIWGKNEISAPRASPKDPRSQDPVAPGSRGWRIRQNMAGSGGMGNLSELASISLTSASTCSRPRSASAQARGNGEEHQFAQTATICYGHYNSAMSRVITQRELRNQSAAVLREVEAGRTVVVTRNGTPVAEMRPLRPRRFVPRAIIADAAARAPRVDAARFRADLDAVIDQRVDG